MKNTVLVPALLLLAACGREAEQPAANTAANQANAAAPAEAPAAVPSLAGAWSITQINGSAPAQVWPMTVNVTADRLTLTSECRTFAWGFRQDRNIVQLTPQAGKECGRVKSPAELVVEKPMNLANIAMFSDEGRSVELSGPGGRVAMIRR